MSQYAAHEEAAREEDAVRRAREIEAAEEAAELDAEDAGMLSPDAQIAQARQSGRHQSIAPQASSHRARRRAPR